VRFAVLNAAAHLVFRSLWNEWLVTVQAYSDAIEQSLVENRGSQVGTKNSELDARNDLAPLVYSIPTNRPRPLRLNVNDFLELRSIAKGVYLQRNLDKHLVIGY
jgi:hypothetical protein